MKKKNNINRMLCVALSILLVFVLAACGGGNAGSGTTGDTSGGGVTATGETIKLGAIYPLTGSVAAIGENIRHGLEMAVDEVNAAGGVNGKQIELVWGDTQGDPKIGMSEAERLITQENVVALVGCYQSAVTEVVAQVAQQYQIPLISAISSATALTTHDNQYFYRLALNNMSNIENMLKFTKSASDKMNLNLKKFAVFTDNSVLGQEVVDSAKLFADKYGFQLVDTVVHNTEASDLSPEIMKLKGLDIDFVIASQYVADAILATNTMKELNFKPKMYVTMAAGYIDPSYLQNVGANGNGMVTLAEFAADSPRGATENAKFKAAYGVDMNGHSAMAYTAIWLYKNIFELAEKNEGEITRESVQQELSVCNFTGAKFPDGTPFILPYDTITFSDDVEMNGVKHTNLNPNAVPTFVQVQNGAYVSVWPWDVAKADIAYPAPWN